MIVIDILTKNTSDKSGIRPRMVALVDSGAAYVFARDASVWSQRAYLKASAIDANDRFGANLDVDGNTLIVRTPLEDSSATSVNGDDTDNSALHAGAI